MKLRYNRVSYKNEKLPIKFSAMDFTGLDSITTFTKSDKKHVKAEVKFLQLHKLVANINIRMHKYKNKNYFYIENFKITSIVDRHCGIGKVLLYQILYYAQLSGFDVFAIQMPKESDRDGDPVRLELEDIKNFYSRYKIDNQNLVIVENEKELFAGV